jgi:hypothetical protein
MTAVFPPTRRHPASISLGLCLCTVVLLALPLSIVGNWRSQVIQEHRAAVRLRELGGMAEASEMYKKFVLPKECQGPIEMVCMQRWSGHSPLTDETVQLLLMLPNLQSLCLGCERKPTASPGVYGVSLAPLSRLPQLKGLTLEFQATDADVLCFLSQRHLTGLSIRGAPITDACLVLAERNSNLRGIELTDTAITDEGLRKLATLKQLRVLELGRTRITSAGLGHLRGMKQLQYLDLQGTAIDDDAIPHLAELSSLNTLNLTRTQLTPGGIQKVHSLLQQCSRIDF